VIALYCPDLPPTPGGVSDHTLALARALEAMGHPPAVFGRRGDAALFAPLPCRVGMRPGNVAGAARAHGARTVVVQYVPFLFARRGVSLALVMGLRRMARQGLRLAVIVHEPYVPFTRLVWLLTGWPMRWQFAYLMRLATHVYTPVPRFAELARRFTRPDAHVRVAPVGATLPISRLSREEARRALGLEDAPVAIGVFSPAASGFAHDWVVAAARRLERRPEVVWVMFGFGSDRLPPGYPAGENVVRLGRCDALAIGRVMRALDIAVAPYVDGLTLRRTGAMLALAHGVPTVSSTGPLFDSQLAGIAACESSPEAFAARVERLVTSPSDRAAVARRSAGYDAVASGHVLARQLAADLT
jgi:glycosyltransferase involved in cell wall biosynthesis